METEQNQENQDFFQKNRNYLIAGLIILALLIVYFATRGPVADDELTQEEQTTEQTDGEQTDTNTENQNENNGSENQNQTPTPEESAQTPRGNLAITGTLLASDDDSRGNLMLESNQGTLYIQTQRDFTSLIDEEVTLDAEGTIQSFVFYGFVESDGETVAGTDTDATGGPVMDGTEEGTVTLSGELKLSNNTDRGNYMILSDKGTIYLKSVRDYSALLDQEVVLTAQGSIQSFTHARVSAK